MACYNRVTLKQNKLTVSTSENLLKNNDVLKTLRQVSLIFFFVIGGTHILTALFTSQNILMPLANTINRVLDIPFAIIGTILGLSQAKIDSDSSGKTYYFILMGIITLFVLGIMLYINLLIPDKIV